MCFNDQLENSSGRVNLSISGRQQGLFSSVLLIRKGHSEEMLSHNHHLLISADKFCLLVSLRDQKRPERGRQGGR